MKVIILKTKEVKKVPLGYAVNYLLPKKKAVIATKERLAKIKQEEKEVKLAKKVGVHEDRQLAERLDGKVVVLKLKAGKSGQIHGSVTKKEIAKNLEILKANVVLAKPIKKLGEYEVKLKFGKAKARVKLKLQEAK